VRSHLRTLIKEEKNSWNDEGKKKEKRSDVGKKGQSLFGLPSLYFSRLRPSSSVTDLERVLVCEEGDACRLVVGAELELQDGDSGRSGQRDAQVAVSGAASLLSLSPPSSHSIHPASFTQPSHLSVDAHRARMQATVLVL